MKKIRAFILQVLFTLLFPILVLAQSGSIVRNDSASTTLGSGNGYASAISVTSKGKIFIESVGEVIPGTGATDLGKAEDAAAASGDTGVAQLFKRTDTAAAQTDTTGDYTVPVANSYGAPQINIDSTFQASAATGILKAGQAAATSTDSGVLALAQRSGSASTTDLAGGAGKYSQLQTTTLGGLASDWVVSTIGAATMYTYTSAASSNATNPSGGQGRLYSINWCNTQATARYLKLHDINGTPTCASTTIKQQWMLPGNTCFSPNLGIGLNFASGISFCITANAGADNTAIGAGDIILNMGFR